jgi:xylulose-5-phosphate/fructose-6-phosphate phosphoketolase
MESPRLDQQPRNYSLLISKIITDCQSAWHGYKYIDPKESGAIIPIIHVNGFKISERTIYGCMDDLEITALFAGYGYQAQIIQDLEHVDQEMSNALNWALGEIQAIQKAARSGQPIMKPRWPVLILRTPKVVQFEIFEIY